MGGKMPFWSTEKLKTELSEHIISPYKEKNIKYGAYELCLGKEYYITSDGTKTKKQLENNEQLSIAPGQFALLTTDEIITIPANNLCFISIKAGIKFRGLVNISGFHVDPGFHGRLKFSVYNVGSQDINVTQGKNLFIIWFAEFNNVTKDVYKGENGGDEAITSDDVMKITGDIPSPAQLCHELKEVKRRLDVLEGLRKTRSEIIRNFSIALIAGIIVFLLGVWWNSADLKKIFSQESRQTIADTQKKDG